MAITLVRDTMDAGNTPVNNIVTGTGCRICSAAILSLKPIDIKRGLCAQCTMTGELIVRMTPEQVGKLLVVSGFRLNVDVSIVRADAGV